jgi:PAS domain S-box-containing protein
MTAGSDPNRTHLEYLKFLDNLHDGYVETDRDGVITFANQPFIQNLGYVRRDDLHGKYFWQFTREKYAKGVSLRFKSMLDTGQPSQLLKVVFSGNRGKEFIGEAAVSPLVEGGIIAGTRSIIRNITRSFEAEKETAYQKDLLDALLQQAPIAIAVVNKQKKITLINEAFQNLFGTARDEVIGKKLNQFLLSSEILKRMKEPGENHPGEPAYLTDRRIGKDGRTTDVEVFVQPFFAGSINHGHLIFYNDITEQRKAELELQNMTTAHRAVLDTLQDAYFEADLTGFLTYVNKKFVESTQYSGKNELIGTHFRHLITKDFRTGIMEKFKEMLSTAHASPPIEIKYRTKNGNMFSSEVVAVPMVEEGKVVGTRGIIRDISIRVKAEEILKAAKVAAETRAGELAGINRLAEKLNKSLNLQEILHMACKELTRILPLQSAGIALYDDDHTVLEVRSYYSNAPDDATHTGKPGHSHDFPALGNGWDPVDRRGCLQSPAHRYCHSTWCRYRSGDGLPR